MSEFSLLDLLISIFGEIDDSKIINLKKHIDQLILKDENLVNIEFLIRSEKSIENLCRRNIPCHFETFFPNTFYDLISQVRKTNIESADFTSDEKLAFESFCKYVAIKKEPKDNILHQIDYTNCFNIALENKNLEIANFVVILLRYYVMVWSDSEHAESNKITQDAALNKFNQNLFNKLKYIIENDLGEIIIFLMDIKKLDQLMDNKKLDQLMDNKKLDQLMDNKKLDQLMDNKKLDQEHNRREFLEYDLDRFNSKCNNLTKFFDLANFFKRTEDGDKKKEFLQFAKDNELLLKHESVKQIFKEKWREKAAIKYYFTLLMIIVFVVFYTIYIELKGKIDVDATLQLSAWCISLILAIINLILEIFQCLMHLIKGKFEKYKTRYTNKSHIKLDSHETIL